MVQGVTKKYPFYNEEKVLQRNQICEKIDEPVSIGEFPPNSSSKFSPMETAGKTLFSNGKLKVSIGELLVFIGKQ